MNKSAFNSGEKHYAWKGDNVGYHTLHKWMRKNYPIKYCEYCGEKDKIEMANITGNYNRDFLNWRRLCRKCHYGLDDWSKNLIQYSGTYQQRSDATRKAWITRRKK